MLDKETLDIIHQNYHASHHNNDWHNNNLGFGFILYSIIRNVRPENVLVVGSQKGYIPAICGLACKDEGKGKVFFVDAGYDSKSENKDEAFKSWGGVGIWKNADSSYWKPLGVEDYIKIFPITTEEFCSSNKDKFDVIFIDGDHSYQGVKKDYDLLWERLSYNGFMLFHDVLVDRETEWGRCGVKDFWSELICDCWIKAEGLTLPFDCGLGILRKLK